MRDQITCFILTLLVALGILWFGLYLAKKSICTPYQLFNKTIKELLVQHKTKEHLTYHQLRLLQQPERWNLINKKDGTREFQLKEGNHLWRIFYDMDKDKWIFVDPVTTVPVSPAASIAITTPTVTRVPTAIAPAIAPAVTPLTPSVVVQPSLVTTRDVVQGISRYIR